MHAALADRARLRITDTLSEGDASPSELAGMLAMPSNLLAHHLRVLQEAGLVSPAPVRGGPPPYLPAAGPRRAGRPRRPRPGGAARGGCCSCAPPTPRARTWPPRCGGGPARSRPRRPARTRPARSPRARSTPPQRHGLPLPAAHPRHISDVRHDGDLVVTVCDLAHEELGGLAAVHWSVPDPVPAGDPGSFDAALAELSRRVGLLAPRVAAAS